MSTTLPTTQQDHLFLVVSCGNAVGANCLLKKVKINCDFHKHFCETPLVYTVDKGYVECADVLLMHGADVNLQGRTDKNKTYRTALQIAAESNDAEAVRLLLKYNADINLRDSLGKSALTYALEEDCTEVVEILLQAKAEVTQTEKKFLKGKKMDKVDKNGFTFSEANQNKACLYSVNDNGKLVSEHITDINKLNYAGETLLHDAVRKGIIHFVKSLLDNGANVRIANRRGLTPLHKAAQYGFTDILALLLETGGDVNDTNAKGLTPLHLAAEYGRVDCVKFLLDHGADFTACDANGVTPLHLAVTSRSVDSITALVEKNASPFSRYSYGYSALDLAVLEGRECTLAVLKNVDISGSINSFSVSPVHFAAYFNAESLEALIDLGVNVSTWAPNVEFFPLHMAVRTGNVKSVELLIRHKAQVNFRNTLGTPLHVAVIMNEKECLKLLLRGGANPQIKDNDRRSPLHIAIKQSNIECVQILLECYAFVDVQDNDGDTPLHYALTLGSQECTSKLLDHGANIFLKNKNGISALDCARRIDNAFFGLLVQKSKQRRDENGNTSLHLAVYYSAEHTRLAINAGADVNEKNSEGNTALHLAARKGDLEMILLMLEAGASVNLRSEEGLSPLHNAVIANAEDCVEVLIRYGASINSLTDKGQTPLHIATFHWPTGVKKLIYRGADVNAKEDGGMTPLHIASMNGFTECVKDLLENGASVSELEDNGISALHFAVESRRPSCMELLLQYGADVNVRATSHGDTVLHLASYNGYVEGVKLLIPHFRNVNILNFDDYTPLMLAKQERNNEIVRILRESFTTVEEHYVIC